MFGKSRASQVIIDQDASITHRRSRPQTALAVRGDAPHDQRTKHQQRQDEQRKRERDEIEARWRDERRRVSEARNTPPDHHPIRPRDRGERMSADDVVSAGMTAPFVGSGSRAPIGSYIAVFAIASIVILVLFH